MTDIADYSRAARGAALGARLRRLSERIDREGTRIYAARGLQFEQRWYGVINQIRINGPMTVGEIAGALRITHVSVSQARRSLEAAGLATALPDDADARRRRLALTPSGRALVEELAPLWDAMNHAAAELNEESGDVVALLDRLEAALDARSLYDRIAARIARTPASQSGSEFDDAQ